MMYQPLETKSSESTMSNVNDHLMRLQRIAINRECLDINRITESRGIKWYVYEPTKNYRYLTIRAEIGPEQLTLAKELKDKGLLTAKFCSLGSGRYQLLMEKYDLLAIEELFRHKQQVEHERRRREQLQEFSDSLQAEILQVRKAIEKSTDNILTTLASNKKTMVDKFKQGFVSYETSLRKAIQESGKTTSKQIIKEISSLRTNLSKQLDEQTAELQQHIMIIFNEKITPSILANFEGELDFIRTEFTIQRQLLENLHYEGHTKLESDLAQLRKDFDVTMHEHVKTILDQLTVEQGRLNKQLATQIQSDQKNNAAFVAAKLDSLNIEELGGRFKGDIKKLLKQQEEHLQSNLSEQIELNSKNVIHVISEKLEKVKQDICQSQIVLTSEIQSIKLNLTNFEKASQDGEKTSFQQRQKMLLEMIKLLDAQKTQHHETKGILTSAIQEQKVAHKESKTILKNIGQSQEAMQKNLQMVVRQTHETKEQLEGLLKQTNKVLNNDETIQSHLKELEMSVIDLNKDKNKFAKASAEMLKKIGGAKEALSNLIGDNGGGNNGSIVSKIKHLDSLIENFKQFQSQSPSENLQSQLLGVKDLHALIQAQHQESLASHKKDIQAIKDMISGHSNADQLSEDLDEFLPLTEENLTMVLDQCEKYAETISVSKQQRELLTDGIDSISVILQDDTSIVNSSIETQLNNTYQELTESEKDRQMINSVSPEFLQSIESFLEAQHSAQLQQQQAMHGLREKWRAIMLRKTSENDDILEQNLQQTASILSSSTTADAQQLTTTLSTLQQQMQALTDSVNTMMQAQQTHQQQQLFVEQMVNMPSVSQEASMSAELSDLDYFYYQLSTSLEKYFYTANMIIEQKLDTNDNLKKLTDGLTFASEFIPVPYLTLGIDLVSKGAQKIKNYREKNKAESSLALLEGTNGHAMLKEAVSQITYKYQNQIQQLKRSSIKKLVDCIVNNIASYLSDISSQTCLDLPYREKIAALVNGAIESNLKNVSNTPLERKSNISDNVSGYWTAEGLLRRTGICIENPPPKRFFTKQSDSMFFKNKSNSRPEKYGFRLGDENEVNRYGYRQSVNCEEKVFVDASKNTQNRLYQTPR